MKFLTTSLLITSLASSALCAKDLIEYFLPMPITSPLTSETWGLPAVLPRDVENGIEDRTNKAWCYWDGKILKGKDGRYHLYASKWAEAKGHWDWKNSIAIHAVADKVTGPYIDQGPLFADHRSRGHNVTALQLPDGRYAVLLSETRPGDVYIADNPHGPWTFQGTIKVDPNGFKADRPSNWTITLRPDGSFLIITRHGLVMLSTDGIMGPYKVQGTSVYPNIRGLNNRTAEDPVVWTSGGRFHLVVNWWDDRKAYHLTSPDGIRDWKLEGLAYDPRREFIRYTDGTINRWTKLERPNVVLENGEVTHFTFAVIDSEKEVDLGNDTHGSKVIVVPFDGKHFNADFGAK